MKIRVLGASSQQDKVKDTITSMGVLSSVPKLTTPSLNFPTNWILEKTFKTFDSAH